MSNVDYDLLLRVLAQANNHVFRVMAERIHRNEPLALVHQGDGHDRPVYMQREEADPGSMLHPDLRPANLSIITRQDNCPLQRSIEVPFQAEQTPLSATSFSSDASSSSGSSDSSVTSLTTTAVKRSMRSATYDPDYTPGNESTAPRFRSGSASLLKRSFSEHQGRALSGRKRMGEFDPENREILRLRQEELKDFDEIAQILNAKRVKTNQEPSLTTNAIYSRYKRNGPLIAASEGREFVPTYMDRKSNGSSIRFRKAPPPIKGFDARQDELLVQAVNDIERSKWELVAHRLEELGGKKHESDMCAMRYGRI